MTPNMVFALNKMIGPKRIRARLALVVPGLPDGGGGVPAVARFLLGVAQRNGFEAKVVSLATSRKDPASRLIGSPSSWLVGPSVSKAQWEGCPVHHVGANLGEIEFFRYKPRHMLAQVIADCDVVQVVSGSPAWANAVVGMGKPVSLQVATRAKVERRLRDGQPNTGVAGWWRRSMTKAADKLDDRALATVDAIQLENPWMLQYSRNINERRNNVDIRYAPPGLNAERFRPLPERIASADPYILCVGRLDDVRKNVGLLIDAFGKLPGSLSHVRLVTAGSGPPPQEYWRKVEALGLRDRVRHIHRPEEAELVKLYQGAAAFALSSDEEGLGIVVLEAMACGVPVVATRCGGPDGIITDAKDGFLTDLDDAQAMADRLALLCADWLTNRSMGRRARETIEKRYAEDVAGAEFVDTWERLIRNVGTR